MHKGNNTIILGAGITGLAAGYKTGFPIFEAKDIPGGICASYYVKAGRKTALTEASADKEAYRFEIGGGHWIFGTDESITRFLDKFCAFKKYARRSAVYFSKENLYVPYPLQNNLRYLPNDVREKALREILNKPNPDRRPNTLEEWLKSNFGKTLYQYFFFPFHELYTAGFLKKIAPQDYFKTPVDISKVVKGAQAETEQVGYNVEFVYPKEGLNALVENIAKNCAINYRKEVVKIDSKTRTVYFKDKTHIRYDKLISTLPLNRMLKMANINPKEKADPYTSVLILNIGAKKGKSCPPYHWLYKPDSKSGFYRVGFYSNVDESFLPKRKAKNTTSIYVERAFKGGQTLSDKEIRIYSRAVVKKLQGWGFIKEVEVIDPNWIDVAYTWSWPGSTWREVALKLLRKNNIYQIGRYGRWKFQGIAKSIKEGLSVDL